MRIYRGNRFAPPSKTSRKQVDPRFDTFALLLILIDLVLLAVFAWKAARLEAAAGAPNSVILSMSLLSAVPSLVGLGLWYAMRGRVYIFSLPLLAMSLLMFPGLNYLCSSILARPLLPYALDAV